MRTLHVKWELHIKPDVILPEIWLNDVIMTGVFSFFDSFLFCCIKAHTRPCRARQGGVHKGTEPWHCRAGTCNTWHGHNGTEHPWRSLSVSFCSTRGSRKSSSRSSWCIVWDRALLSTLGLLNFYKFLFHFLPCCLAKSWGRLTSYKIYLPCKYENDWTDSVSQVSPSCPPLQACSMIRIAAAFPPCCSSATSFFSVCWARREVSIQLLLSVLTLDTALGFLQEWSVNIPGPS